LVHKHHPNDMYDFLRFGRTRIRSLVVPFAGPIDGGVGYCLLYCDTLNVLWKSLNLTRFVKTGSVVFAMGRIRLSVYQRFAGYLTYRRLQEMRPTGHEQYIQGIVVEFFTV
jgi:hypothetical protein